MSTTQAPTYRNNQVTANNSMNYFPTVQILPFYQSQQIVQPSQFYMQRPVQTFASNGIWP